MNRTLGHLGQFDDVVSGSSTTAGQVAQRYLTDSEVNAFLLRHPVTAATVAATLALLKTGAYDFDNSGWNTNPPGVLPPWGMSVPDSVFTNVVLFPGQDAKIYYSGHVPAWRLGDINKAPYEPPPHDRGPFDDLKDLGKTALLVGGLVIGAYVVNSFRRS
jgi:hypothetical protein